MRPGFSLRRVGWAEGGAEGGTGGIRAAVVAEGGGTCPTGPLQHARLEVGVAPGVLHQVVTAHEALVTERAAELLLPRVGTVVAGQLIRTGKLLTAVRPGARKRTLSCSTRRGDSCQYLLNIDSNTA